MKIVKCECGGDSGSPATDNTTVCWRCPRQVQGRSKAESARMWNAAQEVLKSGKSVKAMIHDAIKRHDAKKCDDVARIIDPEYKLTSKRGKK